jgi:hypothetical protein
MNFQRRALPRLQIWGAMHCGSAALRRRHHSATWGKPRACYIQKLGLLHLGFGNPFER